MRKLIWGAVLAAATAATSSASTTSTTTTSAKTGGYASGLVMRKNFRLTSRRPGLQYGVEGNEAGRPEREGPLSQEATRGKGPRGRGSSRAPKHILPRSARWAGVGVFVFGGVMLACGDDGISAAAFLLKNPLKEKISARLLGLFLGLS
jgi:hypothetical protein